MSFIFVFVCYFFGLHQKNLISPDILILSGKKLPFDGLIDALSCYDIWNQEIIVKTADDPNGRVVLGPNEPIFLRRTVGMLFVFFLLGKFSGNSQVREFYPPKNQPTKTCTS